MVEVKKLPVMARVRVVHRRQSQADPLVDLTGHKLQLVSVDDAVFLRTNAINNGLTFISPLTNNRCRNNAIDVVP